MLAKFGEQSKLVCACEGCAAVLSINSEIEERKGYVHPLISRGSCFPPPPEHIEPCIY